MRDTTELTLGLFSRPKPTRSSTTKRTFILLTVLALGCLCAFLFMTNTNGTTTNSFLASNTENNYQVVAQHNTDSTFWAIIQYIGSNPTYLKSQNPYIKFLNLSLTFQSTTKFNVKITDANNTRWEIPHQAPFPRDTDNTTNIPLNNGAVTISIKQEPFSFSLTRKDTNEVIFDTSADGFIYSDLYIELSTRFPRKDIYGFGERCFMLQLPSGGYTLWPKDQFAVLGDNKPGSQTYGYHPVYLLHEQSGNFDMVYLRSSNAMDVYIDTDSRKLTYKIAGGILDFHFFLGDKDPETSVRAYHDYIGGWTYHPFWAHGWHQSKYGSPNSSYLEQVVKNYTANKLPLDVIWSDIDYMDRYFDFSVDSHNFPPDHMRQFLAEQKKRWVPIIDAGIGINDESTFYKKGLEYDIYLKDASGQYLEAQVWPGLSYFPDFHNPKTSQFWFEGLDYLYNTIPFSGIWLDMNEPANFCDSNCKTGPNTSHPYNDLPYTPGGAPLYHKTVDTTAKHYDGAEHFNAHSYFGFLEGKATNDYLLTRSPLTFILSRSNFPGSGQVAAHWTGDNVAMWEFLRYSVAQTMAFNIFGIPMTGADICGFLGTASETLCARWIQLGAFYPFARDHHANDDVNQAPYALGPVVLSTAQASLSFRYALLKHYYSLFLEKKGRGTIFRPLFFEFPSDENLYGPQQQLSESQFMLGKGLLVAPCLDDNGGNVNLYLPQGTWYDFKSRQKMQDACDTPRVKTIQAPLNESAPVFVRAGWVIPFQNTDNVLRSDDLDNSHELRVALATDSEGHFYASGKILALTDMSDQSVNNRCIGGNCLLDVSVSGDSKQLKVQFSAVDTSNVDEVAITGFVLYGTGCQPSSASLQLNSQPVIGVQFQNDSSTGSTLVKISNKVIVNSGDQLVINLN